MTAGLTVPTRTDETTRGLRVPRVTQTRKPATMPTCADRGGAEPTTVGPKLVRINLNDVDALMVPLDNPADRLPIRPTVRKFRDGTVRQNGASNASA